MTTKTNASVIGIDIGYGNVKYCRRIGDKIETNHFPSIVSEKPLEDKGTGIIKQRNVAEVLCGSKSYLVGPDSIDGLSSQDEVTGHLIDDYTKTPTFKSLFMGALHYLDVDNVDYLITGLPVSDY